MTTEFENSVIKELIQAGISMEQIQLQKKNIFQETHVEYYYDKVENSESLRKDISVEKIIGIKMNEAIVGKSVYDLFMEIIKAERDNGKSDDDLESLKKNGLLYQQTFYSEKLTSESPSPIRFNYYQEDDYYILQDEGFQRMIAAKMLTAPFFSGIVTVYKLNEEKKKSYEEYLTLKQLLRLTDIKGLTFELFQEKKDADDKKIDQ